MWFLPVLRVLGFPFLSVLFLLSFFSECRNGGYEKQSQNSTDNHILFHSCFPKVNESLAIQAS